MMRERKVKNLNFVFSVLCLSLTGCSNYVGNVAELRENDKRDVVVGSSSPENQDFQILSNEFSIAKKALVKAISEGNVKILRLGLKSKFLPIRQEIVGEIGKLDEHAFVPDLIEALKANQIILEGGTETKYEQKELDRAIIAVLGKLTGVGFSDFTDGSPKNIQKVIQKSQEWWDKNKSKYTVPAHS